MKSRKIENPSNPNEFDGMAGWPRPYYVGKRTYMESCEKDDKTYNNFVQYITSTPQDQIFHCDEGRTNECYNLFLCSSCADPLSKDNPGWLNAADGSDIGLHIASPMCTRCFALATTACPAFARLDRDSADFVKITTGRQIVWYDESTGEIELTSSAIRPKKRHSTNDIIKFLKANPHLKEGSS